MAKIIDIKCNVEFISDAVYLQHKNAGHKGLLEKSTPIDTPPEPTPLTDIPKEALPTQEFIDTINRIEAKEKEIISQPSQHPAALPIAAPIKPIYKFIGECPDHRTPVDTFELEVAEKYFIIAVCATDKKQLSSKEVEKLG